MLCVRVSVRPLLASMFDELDTRTQRTMEKEGLLEPITLVIGAAMEEAEAEVEVSGGAGGREARPKPHKQPISPATDRSASTRATDDGFGFGRSAAPPASGSRYTCGVGRVDGGWWGRVGWLDEAGIVVGFTGGCRGGGVVVGKGRNKWAPPR